MHVISTELPVNVEKRRIFRNARLELLLKVREEEQKPFAVNGRRPPIRLTSSIDARRNRFINRLNLAQSQSGAAPAPEAGEAS
jgi:hypothetical protein